jgi:hypothetical protein
MSIFSSISSRASTSTRMGWSSRRLSVRVDATTVTLSSRLGCCCNSTMTSCIAPAPSCTDVVTGANPGFTIVMSTLPAAVTTVVVPDASVRWLAPATTTSASSIGFCAART